MNDTTLTACAWAVLLLMASLVYAVAVHRDQEKDQERKRRDAGRFQERS